MIRTPQGQLMRLAQRQHGVFRSDQAMQLGVSRSQLQTMAKAGLIQRRRRGTYIIVGSRDCHQRRAMGAILSGPATCVASHFSAAYLHGLLPEPPVVDVTVPRNHRLRLDDVIAHRSVLPPGHVATIDQIPVTSLARTVVDVASTSDLETVASILDPLLTSERLYPRRLQRVIDEIVAAPGRHGTTLLRTALDVWINPIKPGSPAEARLLRLLREHGYGQFSLQHEVTVADRTCYLDVAWPADRIALEYAGKDFHHPRHWDDDEERAAAIESLGWTVREVDRNDLVPSRLRLWNWLAARLRPAA